MATSTPQDRVKTILEALARRTLTNAEMLRVTTAIAKMTSTPGDATTPVDKAKRFLNWLRMSIRQTAYTAEVRDAQAIAMIGINLLDIGEDE